MIALIAAVRDRVALDPTTKHVANVLASYTNEAGEAWPSNDRLATDTGLSKRTVQRSLHKIRAHHVIDLLRPGGMVWDPATRRWQRVANVWRFNMAILTWPKLHRRRSNPAPARPLPAPGAMPPQAMTSSATTPPPVPARISRASSATTPPPVPGPVSRAVGVPWPDGVGRDRRVVQVPPARLVGVFGERVPEPPPVGRVLSPVVREPRSVGAVMRLAMSRSRPRGSG